MCWLLAWALGGIVVMSLIPSKRVDRIFPSIPPLCLLLAAQLNYFRQSKHSEALLRRIVIGGIVASAVYAGGYTATRVIQGYRTHRDALEEFGREVRCNAQTSHLRYEVVRAPDEGLLLYLRKTHFIEPDQAVAEWNRGNLDALVASTEKAPALLGELRDASLSSLKSGKKEQGKDYVLVTR